MTNMKKRLFIGVTLFLLLIIAYFFLNLLSLENLDTGKLVERNNKYQNAHQFTDNCFILIPLDYALLFLEYRSEVLLGSRMKNSEERREILMAIISILQTEDNPKIIESYIYQLLQIIICEIRDILNIDHSDNFIQTQNGRKSFVSVWYESKFTLFDFPNRKSIVELLRILLSKEGITLEGKKRLLTIIGLSKELPSSIKEPLISSSLFKGTKANAITFIDEKEGVDVPLVPSEIPNP